MAPQLLRFGLLTAPLYPVPPLQSSIRMVSLQLPLIPLRVTPLQVEKYMPYPELPCFITMF